MARNINAIAFGLCKRYGIDLPDDATPQQAWEALKRNTGKSIDELTSNADEKKGQEKKKTAKEETPKNGTKSHNEIKFREVTPEEFSKTLKAADESNPIKYRWRVTLYDAEHYKGSKLYVTGGGSTVAVTPDGDIISLCKNKKGGEHGVGKALLRKAVKEGGVKLDAYGEKLFNIYTSNGFEPVSWTEWDSEYAPEDWLKAKALGEAVEEEPVIFYKYTGKSVDIGYEEFIDNVLPSESYEVAQTIRDEEI